MAKWNPGKDSPFIGLEQIRELTGISPSSIKRRLADDYVCVEGEPDWRSTEPVKCCGKWLFVRAKVYALLGIPEEGEKRAERKEESLIKTDEDLRAIAWGLGRGPR